MATHYYLNLIWKRKSMEGPSNPKVDLAKEREVNNNEFLSNLVCSRWVYIDTLSEKNIGGKESKTLRPCHLRDCLSFEVSSSIREQSKSETLVTATQRASSGDDGEAAEGWVLFAFLSVRVPRDKF